MKSPLKHISDWFLALARVFRREFAIVISDAGALLFFIGLPLAYPIVYTLIYNPEVVNKVAVAVVDDSRPARASSCARPRPPRRSKSTTMPPTSPTPKP